MPFRLTVSTTEVGPHPDASHQFPELTVAPMGRGALMLQIRTTKWPIHPARHPEDATFEGMEAPRNQFYSPGVILVLRYDTHCRPVKHHTQPLTTAVLNVALVSVPKTRQHTIHSGSTLHRPRRVPPVLAIRPMTSEPTAKLAFSSVFNTTPFLRPSKRCRHPDDVGGSVENLSLSGMVGWLYYRQTKRRLL